MALTRPWCPTLESPCSARCWMYWKCGSSGPPWMILVQALIGIPVVGLRIVHRPGADLVLIHPDLIVLDPGVETMQPLGGIVRADASLVAVVPIVQAADDIAARRYARRTSTRHGARSGHRARRPDPRPPSESPPDRPRRTGHRRGPKALDQTKQESRVFASGNVSKRGECRRCCRIDARRGSLETRGPAQG